MLKKYCLLFFIISNFTSFSQSISVNFFKLSSPEKHWVIFHPFKAKKAFIISNETLRITDSISKTNLIDDDINGGQLDAFKHSFWMACLTQKIGSKSALKLGDVHEKGNYISYKKGLNEDGNLPDKISSTMDLFNNKIGSKIAIDNLKITNKELILFIIEEINNGNMRILKKDNYHNFLNCSGDIISKETLKGKWENDKCLIPSNSNFKTTN